MKYLWILFIFTFVITKSAQAEEKPFFIKCTNQKNSIVLDFKINKHKNSYTTVYRKIKNKFIEIGEVVGQKKSIVLDFKINKHKNSYTTVYRKIKNKFIEIGEVVGQKKSSFILFEDKYAYLGVDFAWHYDKNTYKLQPVLLSKGTIKLEKLPEKLTCLIN